MKLHDFSKDRHIEEEINEAGGIIDRKILSKLGSKRTKMKAQSRVTDKARGEQLWDAWLTVTGGGDDFNINEVVSWLVKEVKIDGIDVNKDIINAAVKGTDFEKMLTNPISTTKSVNTPIPKKSPVKKTRPKKSPAKKPTSTLSKPADNAPEAEWHRWAEALAKSDPNLYAKLAKSFGAKISTPGRTRGKK